VSEIYPCPGLSPQVLDREENACIIKEQYAATQKMYQTRVDFLDAQNASLKDKCRQLERRRALQAEGFGSEITQVRGCTVCGRCERDHPPNQQQRLSNFISPPRIHDRHVSHRFFSAPLFFCVQRAICPPHITGGARPFLS
jgi:hypothetical protein